MAKHDLRGSGWRFPIRPDANGNLVAVDGDENVAQSVHLLLATVAGERPMRPTFGTTAVQSLFDGSSEQNLHRIEEALSDAIRQWEPRVELDAVNATRRTGDDTTVEVRVAYRVRRTNTRRTLVFPYYVESIGVGP